MTDEEAAECLVNTAWADTDDDVMEAILAGIRALRVKAQLVEALEAWKSFPDGHTPHVAHCANCEAAAFRAIAATERALLAAKETP